MSKERIRRSCVAAIRLPFLPCTGKTTWTLLTNGTAQKTRKTHFFVTMKEGVTIGDLERHIDTELVVPPMHPPEGYEQPSKAVTQFFESLDHYI